MNKKMILTLLLVLLIGNVGMEVVKAKKKPNPKKAQEESKEEEREVEQMGPSKRKSKPPSEEYKDLFVKKHDQEIAKAEFANDDSQKMFAFASSKSRDLQNLASTIDSKDLNFEALTDAEKKYFVALKAIESKANEEVKYAVGTFKFNEEYLKLDQTLSLLKTGENFNIAYKIREEKAQEKADLAIKQNICLYKNHDGLEIFYGNSFDKIFRNNTLKNDIFYVGYFMSCTKEKLNDRDEFHSFLKKIEQGILVSDSDEVSVASSASWQNEEAIGSKILNFLRSNNVTKELNNRCVLVNNALRAFGNKPTDIIKAFFTDWYPEKQLFFMATVGASRKKKLGVASILVQLNVDENFKITVTISDPGGVDRVMDVEAQKGPEEVIKKLCAWFTAEVHSESNKKIIDEYNAPLNKLKRSLIKLKEKVQELSGALRMVGEKLAVLKGKLAALSGSDVA